MYFSHLQQPWVFLFSIVTLITTMPPNSAQADAAIGFANRATKEARHFIFGYGSLICPQSRAITAPTVAGQPVHPATVHHLERTWTARSGTGTYVAVSFQENSKCSGVLIEVDDDELKQFDIREVGYDRAQIELSHIDFFPSEHEANLDDMEKDVNVWVYVSNNPQPANPAYPILQSYVDIILRGCLGISEDFARSFIQTTEGWWHAGKQVRGVKDEEKETEYNDESHHTWIDDRHSPKYVRADDDYSRSNRHHLDAFLRDHQIDAFQRRRTILTM